jgi:hypothetical protein
MSHFDLEADSRVHPRQLLQQRRGLRRSSVGYRCFEAASGCDSTVSYDADFIDVPRA